MRQCRRLKLSSDTALSSTAVDIAGFVEEVGRHHSLFALSSSTKNLVNVIEVKVYKFLA